MDEHDEETPPAVRPGGPYHMTPAGEAALRAAQERAKAERHRVVEIVAWAAGNGDRSENADYKEGKRRLREIDRRLRYLGQRLKGAVLIDPAAQAQRDRVFFGATVTYRDARGAERRVTIVGEDEADMAAGRVSAGSPIARALLRAHVGDEVTVHTPAGPSAIEITAIRYPDP